MQEWTWTKQQLDDLADSLVDDETESWTPVDPGDGVQGIVIKTGTTKSDFKNKPPAPTVTVQTASGSKYRIIGYGDVLRREILDADPHPGDLFAVRYYGEKAIKKGRWTGKTYKRFGVAVRRRATTQRPPVSGVPAST